MFHKFSKFMVKLLFPDAVKSCPLRISYFTCIANAGDVRGAYDLFGEMSERDTVSWSVMIGGFTRVYFYTKCFGMFKESIRAAVMRNSYTLPCVNRVCRDTLNIQMGRVAHQVVFKCGLDSDHAVSAAFVDMYGKCREIDDARKRFDIMVRKDLAAWAVTIGGYAKCRNAMESLALFDRMRNVGIVPDRAGSMLLQF